MTTPGQYGGPGGPEDLTRPVGAPGARPQHGPQGTQYAPPVGGGFPAPPPVGGGYPVPPQGGQYPPPGPQGGGWPQPAGGGWPPPGPGQYPPFQPPPGRPPGSSSTGMIIGIVVAVVVLLGGAGTAWYFLAGPGSEPRSGTPVATGPSSPAPAPVAPGVPTGAPVDEGDVDSVDVAVGDCVTLGGTVNFASADEATCGSQDANYVVTAKTDNSDQCPQDSDQWFYETTNGVQQGALCLDIDWVEGDCFETSDVVAVRVPCTAPGAQTVRVGKIVQGATDDAECARDEQPYTYDVRRFAVCLQSL